MRQIPLRRRDGSIRAFALVEEGDYESVSHYRWHLTGKGYVFSDQTRSYLHRFILRLESGDPRQADHISGDRLDNRRTNLRIATPAENGQNRRGGHGRYSRHRGVCWDKTRGRWVAYAVIRRRQHFLGRYDDEEEAARAAAAFRRDHMPFSLDAVAAAA